MPKHIQYTQAHTQKIMILNLVNFEGRTAKIEKNRDFRIHLK